MRKLLLAFMLVSATSAHPAFNDIFLQYSSPSSTVDEAEVINNIAKIIDENSAFDENGDTLFYTCCKHGYKNIAQRLIALGHSVNMRNKDGFLPLDAAAMAGHDTLVDLILAQKDTVIEPDETGATCLHWAAKRGRRNIVAKLLQHSANPNAETHETKQTPLIWAASGGKDTAQRLRIATMESITRPPIKDYMEVIAMLVTHGANVNHATSLQFTPLHWALGYYNRDLARILIRYGANIHTRSVDGMIPLEMIQKEGDQHMLAEIDVVAKKGLCLECNKATSKKCSLCKLAYYCSPQCQKNAWMLHKPFCKRATTFDSQKIEIIR